MTITARLARRQTTAAKTMLDRIAVELPMAVDIICRRIVDGDDTDDDGPKAEDAGIRSKGGHSDPTADAALGHVVGQQRYLDDIADQLATLALTLRLLLEPCTREVVSAANAEEHPRCSGGQGVDEWTRPTCTEYVTYNIRGDGSYSYRTDSLCNACRVRRHRWENREVA